MGLITEQKKEIRELLIEKGFDPEIICKFLNDQIEFNRANDELSKVVIGKNEFYTREKVYSEIELLILQLR